MDLFGITGYGYNNIKSKKQERKLKKSKKIKKKKERKKKKNCKDKQSKYMKYECFRLSIYKVIWFQKLANVELI